ncbi:unnamed protein product, partial [Amoebophrya sp. A25]
LSSTWSISWEHNQDQELQARRTGDPVTAKRDSSSLVASWGRPLQRTTTLQHLTFLQDSWFYIY